MQKYFRIRGRMELLASKSKLRLHKLSYAREGNFILFLFKRPSINRFSINELLALLLKSQGNRVICGHQNPCA